MTPAGAPGTCGARFRAEPKHHLTLCTTGRHGCWAYCTCGWDSQRWTTVVGAHLEFGQHLLDRRRDHTTTEQR